MKTHVPLYEHDIYLDPPSRVINIITGGDTDLKDPYQIAFVVHGARSEADYTSVVQRYNQFVKYFNRTRYKETLAHENDKNTEQNV